MGANNLIEPIDARPVFTAFSATLPPTSFFFSLFSLFFFFIFIATFRAIEQVLTTSGTRSLDAVKLLKPTTILSF